jgi:hypothetical protein
MTNALVDTPAHAADADATADQNNHVHTATGGSTTSIANQQKKKNTKKNQVITTNTKLHGITMTDDIVTRLRLWASVTEGDHVIEELHRAADEIERLRAEVNLWMGAAEKFAESEAMSYYLKLKADEHGK